MSSSPSDPATPAVETLTPAERRKRKMRDVIITAAEGVFAAQGLAGLSMRRLAEEIDYSPAAIYKYFTSKLDLMREIREMFFERLLARLAETRVDDDWSIASMKRCMACYIETGLEQPNHYRMAFSFDDADQDDHHEKGQKTHEAAQYLENLIQQGMDVGAFRSVNPNTAANSVWASLHGLTTLMVEVPSFPEHFDEGGVLTREALIDFHLEAIALSLKKQ